ncbi:hypothetical protein [uncultured Clostridium sp.]|jgi:hypothetical protein|uniref:hypothetical protein n=1 Tax=uncultured Clostridium sp. TaxID=59620 RepID=UPI002593412E|nr:hypothetical protein [uncultured Clostridium sp.]
MDEYKVYDREECWRRDRYLAEVSKLKIEIFIAKFKRMILKLQNRRLRRNVERLREK